MPRISSKIQVLEKVLYGCKRFDKVRPQLNLNIIRMNTAATTALTAVASALGLTAGLKVKGCSIKN